MSSFEEQCWKFFAQDKDPVRAMLQLVHAHPRHDMARCQLATTLLFLIGQLGGPAFFPTAPSILLVNAGDGKDEVMNAQFRILKEQLEPLRKSPPKDKEKPEGPYSPRWIHQGNPALCRHTMQAMVARGVTIRRDFDPGKVAWELAHWESHWLAAKEELFPAEEINFYSRAVDHEFGMVTHADDRISLLIHGQHELAKLRADLERDRDALLKMEGVGHEYNRVVKKPSLIGSIPASEWDGGITDKLLKSGLPMLFLPHLSAPRFEFEEIKLLQQFVTLFTRVHRKRAGISRPELWNVPMTGEAAQYEDAILCIAAHLPEPYYFGYQLIIRQLQAVVTKVVLWLGAYNKVSEASIHTSHVLARDLYITALRGIAYGAGSLPFHGYGLDWDGKYQGAREIVTYLRNEGGPLRKRDVSRKFNSLRASRRDEILVGLVDDGLVEIDDHFVEAVPLKDYLPTVATRCRFPAVELLADLAGGKAS